MIPRYDTFLCVGVSLCVGGWLVGFKKRCRRGLTAEQKMTVVLSVPVVWFGPGSLPHVGKTTISQHDASTFLQNRPTEKAYSAIFSCCYFNNKNYILWFFFILLEFSRRDTIQHKTFSWKFLFSYCKIILYLFFFGKDEKFVRHCQKSFNRQTCTTGSAASGGREGINLGQAWVKM